jgi:hypothetical protein
MTVREKLEIEMDKEEIERWEGKNADSEKSDKNIAPSNRNNSHSAGSDQGKRTLGCWWKLGISNITGDIALVVVIL